ncbi:MAG: amidohydrolase family protein, partial [bacterium]
WYNAAWGAYRNSPWLNRPEVNESLAGLQAAATGDQRVVIEVSDELNFLRADKIAREFGLDLWVRGSGYEYRRLDLIKQTGRPVILPVTLPEDPDVDTPEDALDVSLETLRHWDLAPENPKRLADAGVPFAFTADGLKNLSDFRTNIRKMIERGLSEDTALAALTTIPAKWLNEEDSLGRLSPGQIADLVVTDGPLFAEKTKIMDTWVDGIRYEITKKPDLDLRGKWQATLVFSDGRTDAFTITLKGEPDKLEGTISKGDKSSGLAGVTFESRILSFHFKGDDLGYSDITRMSATVSKDGWMGTGVAGDGAPFKWTASPLLAEPENKPGKEAVGTAPPSGGRGEGEGEPSTPEAGSLLTKVETPVTYPPGAFGRATRAPPDQPEWVLVQNATIWTSGPQGKLDSADLLVHKGKVDKVAKDIAAPRGALVIDGYGKQVTPGIIDAHSHTAISGNVNEGTQAISAEVRIGDVTDPNDIYIYRQLAGGLTMAHTMHGSANPIGGQNQIIKLRWGAAPEEMKYANAPKTIKFALGENPKQSNWGDQYTTRYPQTREGVEQIIRDEFQATRDYEKEWSGYTRKKSRGEAAIPPRRDLELDAIVEILHARMEIECHSYRQDEIEMLMRVAENFGFKVGMFHHVLEGYKVADQIAKHGAGATTFSDWWAYKFEVYDAIPYNGTLMHDVGVTVSFKSDSGEMARRLNTEAAKAVKYGGLSEEEALKFVTINPAKQYHMDKWVGSLEPGKDADFVIWNGDPLSTFSRVEQTWADGRKYFDIVEDAQMRLEVQKERERLIQRVLVVKKKDGKGADWKGKPPKDDESLQSGRDPE